MSKPFFETPQTNSPAHDALFEMMLHSRGLLRVEFTDGGDTLDAQMCQDFLNTKSPAEWIETLLENARAQEREACAQIVDTEAKRWHEGSGNDRVLRDLSDKIRGVNREANPAFEQMFTSGIQAQVGGVLDAIRNRGNK